MSTALRLLLVAAVLLSGVLLAACGAANDVMLRNYLESHERELTLPAGSDSTPIRLEIAPGTPARAIGDQLVETGLIRDARLFEAYIRLNGLTTRLQAGVYYLAPSLTLVEIAGALQLGRSEGLLVTIPEGWRIEQTADYLRTANVFSDTIDGISIEAANYRDLALSENSTAIDAGRHPFLQDRPAGASLEGYLFPNTYEMDPDQRQGIDLVQRQLDAFAATVLPAYTAARASGATDLDLYAVLTLASIVEREAVVADERPTIAGVYLNRLAQGIKLDADPTVQYAIGFVPETNQWWKTPMTLEEYDQVVSPFNTYLNPGLPPGPIASPGLSSVQAVLSPEKHDYLYFVALPDGSGRHVFATTYEEQVINVNRYRQGQ